MDNNIREGFNLILNVKIGLVGNHVDKKPANTFMMIGLLRERMNQFRRG